MVEVMEKSLVGCICHCLCSLYLLVDNSTDGCLEWHLVKNHTPLDVITLGGGGGGGRRRNAIVNSA